MSPGSDPSNAVRLSTNSMGVVALVLFVMFGSIMVETFFPLQPLDPVWQLGFGSMLVNAAAFPLAGLVMLQHAAALVPDDPLLQSRYRICSRLAIVASLGFLLLLPLQTAAGLRQNHSLNAARAARIRGAERKLIALRQAVATGRSNAELNDQLQSLDGPVLGPSDLAQPLPLLKSQVHAVLQQAEQQISLERQQALPQSPWLLLPGLVRSGIASIALSIGFAALAQRPGKDMTILQEWQFHRQMRIRRRAAASNTDSYLRQLGENENWR